MHDKFVIKSKTAIALYKHKIIQNKKLILALISDSLKRKL
jgi:hypothetical protein